MDWEREKAYHKAFWDLVDTITEWDFNEFICYLGLTQKYVSKRFDIPYRTVQSWKLGERECPHYIKLMIAELVVSNDYYRFLPEPPESPEKDF